MNQRFEAHNLNAKHFYIIIHTLFILVNVHKQFKLQQYRCTLCRLNVISAYFYTEVY